MDGKFDEPWWSSAVTVGIRRADVNAICRAAADHEFVYFAITVPHLASTVNSAEQTRDMDLSGQRRFRLRMDVDRDLLTAFEFEFDGNGNTRDSCDGFTAFDPRWYVASQVHDGLQHIEIAIQKADLGVSGDAGAETWLASIDFNRLGSSRRHCGFPIRRTGFLCHCPDVVWIVRFSLVRKGVGVGKSELERENRPKPDARTVEFAVRDLPQAANSR